MQNLYFLNSHLNTIFVKGKLACHFVLHFSTGLLPNWKLHLIFLPCLNAKLSMVNAGIALNYVCTNHYHQNWQHCGSTQSGRLQVKISPSCQSLLKGIWCGGISVRWPQFLFANTSNFMWSRKPWVFCPIPLAFHLLKNSSWDHVETAAGKEVFLCLVIFFLLSYKIRGLFPVRISGFIDSKTRLGVFKDFSKFCFPNQWGSSSIVIFQKCAFTTIEHLEISVFWTLLKPAFKFKHCPGLR